MTVTITLNNNWARIKGINDVKLVDELDSITSFYIEGYQYTAAFKKGYYDVNEKKFKYWDGKKHLLNSKMVFPIGLLQRVEKFLKKNNIEYVLEDNRIKYLSEELDIVGYKPRKYQEDALDKVIQNGRGMLKLGTGAGKTLLAAMIAAKYNLPTVIFVVGKDLLYQFHKEIKKALGIDIGLIGDGNYIVKKINVCSVWTAITSFDIKTKISLDDEDWAPEIFEINNETKKLIKNMIENSVVNIYDEAHYLATDTLQQIFKTAKKARYVFGLTASDWRDDGADLLIESVCGPRIFNLPASKLIDEGYLVPANIVIFDVPPNENCGKNYQGVYNNYIINNEIRNKMIIDSAKALINKNRRILILVRYISHGKELAKQLEDIPMFFVNGEIDGLTRERVKKEFEDGELRCLIASSIFDLGVNIPCLDGLILAGGGKSTVRALQRIGRVIRSFEGKKDAIVVDFFDNAKYLDKHSSIRICVYETEPNFKIKLPKNFNNQKIKKINKIIKKIV